MSDPPNEMCPAIADYSRRAETRGRWVALFTPKHNVKRVLDASLEFTFMHEGNIHPHWAYTAVFLKHLATGLGYRAAQIYFTKTGVKIRGPHRQEREPDERCAHPERLRVFSPDSE